MIDLFQYTLIAYRPELAFQVIEPIADICNVTPYAFIL
jgi:hypothetical protein